MALTRVKGAVWNSEDNQLPVNVKEVTPAAVGDYDPIADTGTDDSAAFDAAYAISNFIYVPEGNYLLTSSATHRKLEQATTVGPGIIYGTFFAVNKKFGKQSRFGVARTGIGQDLPGGIVIGGEAEEQGAESEGMRLWAQHPSWMQLQPTAEGFPSQIQVYTKSFLGTATGAVAGDTLTVVVGDFDFTTSWSGGVNLIEVDDEIGWGDTLYLVAQVLSSTQIRIKTLAGGAVSITDGSEKVFRHVYEYSYGVCDVNGTTVTWKSGILFNEGATVGGQNFIYLNGTRFNVASVDSNEQITLTASAGIINDANFIQKDMDFHRSCTILRIQSLAGAKEENVALQIDSSGRFLTDLLSSTGPAPTIAWRGDPIWTGTGEEEHFFMTPDGRFAFNDTPVDDTLSTWFIFNSTPSVVDGAVENLHIRLHSLFNVDNRFAHIGFLNNFQGLNIQSFAGNETTPLQTQINAEGGSVAIGTRRDVASSGFTFAVAGTCGPFGDSLYDQGTTVDRWLRVFSNSFVLRDGITAPATIANHASLYVDGADGDLKIKFGDGTVKTIVTDT